VRVRALEDLLIGGSGRAEGLVVTVRVRRERPSL
jgi:hypothetical protein